MDVTECFKNVCRIVLLDEIGDFNEFEEFLKRYTDKIKQTNSSISGKEVYYSDPYSSGSKFLSLDEMNKLKIEPLKPYEMKDIDGLISAIEERLYYAGNKVLGNSKDIERGENIVDSFHIQDSHGILNCQYVVSSQMVYNSKYLIGCSWGAESSFCLNTTEMFGSNRCFEAAFAIYCNDSYFSYNTKNCNDIMFCFNQYSNRHCIGNTQLPKDKYLELKKKLLGEITQELKEKKSIPSLIDLVSRGGLE
jgi:hypothetical protein